MTDQKGDSVTQAETSMDKLRRASKVAYSTVTLTDAEADALVAEVERLQEALRAIEGMAGAAGAGQIAAMPIAARARAALTESLPTGLPEDEEAA